MGNSARLTGMVHRVALPLLACLLVPGMAHSAPAQELTPGSPDTTTFTSEALNLRFTYPSTLHETDPAQAIADGHLNVLGISADSDPALARATACLHPLLLAKTPESQTGVTSTSETSPDGVTRVQVTPLTSATILLAELDLHCVVEQGKVNANDVLTRMAEVVEKTPRVSRILQPTSYNVNRQRVHIAAAQGQLKSEGETSPFTIFTMGLSTNWNNHLLVWYFTSNNINMLDTVTKSTVAFGRQAPAVLYPVHIRNGNVQAAP